MRKLLLLAALLSLSLMTACGNSTETKEGTALQICRQWEPIYPSKKDSLTDGTAKQIAGNNAANVQWCGNRPPVKEAPSKVPAKVAEARK